MQALVFYNPDGTYSLGQQALMSMQQALTKLYAITKGWLVRLRLINQFSDSFMRGRKGNIQIARWLYRRGAVQARRSRNTWLDRTFGNVPLSMQ